MKRLDRKLRQWAQDEAFNVPQYVQDTVAQTMQTLQTLPQQNYLKPQRQAFRTVGIAATVMFVCMITLPNLSVTAAKAMQGIPIIGSIVRVVTLRSYFYDDGHHSAEVSIPRAEADGSDASLNEAINSINDDIERLADSVIEQFWLEADANGENGHTALSIDYEVITNTDNWLTLKLIIWEGSGGSNTTYKFYHLNKQTGENMTLSKLFKDGADYVAAISSEIRMQMLSRMAANASLTYWVDNKEYPKDNFATINDDENFYFTNSGDLVIAFNKYTVAPGMMGCPTFTIPRDVYADMLK